MPFYIFSHELLHLNSYSRLGFPETTPGTPRGAAGWTSWWLPVWCAGPARWPPGRRLGARCWARRISARKQNSSKSGTGSVQSREEQAKTLGENDDLGSLGGEGLFKICQDLSPQLALGRLHSGKENENKSIFNQSNQFSSFSWDCFSSSIFQMLTTSCVQKGVKWWIFPHEEKVLNIGSLSNVSSSVFDLFIVVFYSKMGAFSVKQANLGRPSVPTGWFSEWLMMDGDAGCHYKRIF